MYRSWFPEDNRETYLGASKLKTKTTAAYDANVPYHNFRTRMTTLNSRTTNNNSNIKMEMMTGIRCFPSLLNVFCVHHKVSSDVRRLRLWNTPWISNKRNIRHLNCRKWNENKFDKLILFLLLRTVILIIMVMIRMIVDIDRNSSVSSGTFVSTAAAATAASIQWNIQLK